MSKKFVPVWIIIVLAGVLAAFNIYAKNTQADSEGDGKRRELLNKIVVLLEKEHYSPKKIDDAFSKKVFAAFLKELDPQKNIFLQSDIDALKKYETKIDDEIHGAPMEFFHAVNTIFEKRLAETQIIYKEVLNNSFDYTIDESWLRNTDSISFPKTVKERDDRWRKTLKYLSIDRYNDRLDERNNSKRIKQGDKDWKADTTLEREARTEVMKLFDRNYNRFKVSFKEEDRFNSFVNTITETMDPYTTYFPPVAKREFDEQISNKFYGIGAQLKEENGYVKIAMVITGSPAWKSGEIQVEDAIVKVAQGSKEPVDITGYEVEDAVKLIRGNKGTEVRLTIKKPDGTTKVVPIIREEIVQDEAYARSAVIEQNGHKIGYIYLPEFYADFETRNGRHCSSDVAAELLKLKAANVEGVVMDLRNNGGGYLNEVVNMVGLFIKSGPVVQVKNKNGKSDVLGDGDNAVLYNGPLTVLVNEFSASASEIFAAAIQDYKRGIIVGSSSTYGKGTVQRSEPFGNPLDFYSGRTDMGALKLTFQKYYRINGGSTQIKGVESDIIIPDEYAFLKIRERDNENALKYDEIVQSSFDSIGNNFDAVKQKSKQRIDNTKTFVLLENNAKWLSDNSQKAVPLKLETYRAEQKKLSATAKQNNALTKLDNPMDIEPLAMDKDKLFNNPDTQKAERYKQWYKNLKTDIYISEAANIVSDIINSNANVAVK